MCVCVIESTRYQLNGHLGFFKVDRLEYFPHPERKDHRVGQTNNLFLLRILGHFDELNYTIRLLSQSEEEYVDC